MVSAVGEDEWGRRAEQELQSHGVNIEGVARFADYPTGAVMVDVDGQGQPTYTFGKDDASVTPFKPRHQVDLTRRSFRGTPRYPDIVGMAKLAFGVVAGQLIDGKDKLFFRVLNDVLRFAAEC